MQHGQPPQCCSSVGSLELQQSFLFAHPRCPTVTHPLPLSRCNLETLIERRKEHLPSRRAFSSLRLLSIALQVAEGLAYLHGLNVPILHRDIKPANCFTTDSMLEMDAAGGEEGVRWME